MERFFKKIILELAKDAVEVAERSIGRGFGSEKKAAAVNYVTSRLPVANLLKPVLASFLTEFIDSSIEFAVDKFKAV